MDGNGLPPGLTGVDGHKAPGGSGVCWKSFLVRSGSQGFADSRIPGCWIAGLHISEHASEIAVGGVLCREETAEAFGTEIGGKAVTRAEAFRFP
jgi:hypothetical protein